MRTLRCMLCLLPLRLAAQADIHVVVDASSVTGTIEPLWGDHYEIDLLQGAGGNPSVSGPKAPFIDDPGFAPEMARLRPRSVRISTGRFDDPGRAELYSTDTAVLRTLWSEFYRGPNTLAGADDPSNYDFSYVDSLTDVVRAMGAEPFLDMAAMPFTLSSADTPAYFPCVYWNPPCHLFAWDNAVRTAPPADPAVYGRVFRHLVKHLHDTRGVRWFEVWNEPDQFPGLTPFWKGDVPQLHAMLSALAAEVGTDPALSADVKIGCCGFAMNSFLNLFMHQFLAHVQQNGTRLDFLSVHPYSSSALGGYDSVRTTQAAALRDLYAPGTPLVNSEWGILDPGFGSAGWNSLDYGLERVRGIIEMTGRGYLFAHAASLADNDTTVSTCCLGMFWTKPSFAPKPAAFAYMAMGRLNGSLERLACTANAPHLALAGRSPGGDTVRIVLPAPDPAPGIGTVTLNVSGLPWAAGTATRHELTMTGFQADQVLTATAYSAVTNGAFTDSVSYASDQGNGRLVLWELVNGGPDALPGPGPAELVITSLPGGDDLLVRTPDGRAPRAVHVLNIHGALVRTAAGTDRIGLGGLSPGMYLIEVETSDGTRARQRRMKR